MKWWDILWRLSEGAVSNWVQQLDRWRWQLLQSLFMIVLAGVCGLGVLLLSAALVLLAFWESHRFEALWGLLLTYAWMAVYLMRRASRLVSGASRPSPRRSSCDGCCSRSASGARAGCGG